MSDHDDNAAPRATITPEQTIDMLQTVSESVMEFMRRYDSPESRRLINALRIATSLVRAMQEAWCQGHDHDEKWGERIAA